MNIRFMMAALLLMGANAVSAENYDGLRFITISGEETVVATPNLEIYFVDGKVVFSTSDVQLPLNTLASMEFCNINSDITSIEAVCIADSPIEIYSIGGQGLGKFNSMVEAGERLGNGVYLIVTPEGNKFKITFSK